MREFHPNHACQCPGCGGIYINSDIFKSHKTTCLKSHDGPLRVIDTPQQPTYSRRGQNKLKALAPGLNTAEEKKLPIPKKDYSARLTGFDDTKLRNPFRKGELTPIAEIEGGEKEDTGREVDEVIKILRTLAPMTPGRESQSEESHALSEQSSEVDPSTPACETEIVPEEDDDDFLDGHGEERAAKVVWLYVLLQLHFFRERALKLESATPSSNSSCSSERGGPNQDDPTDTPADSNPGINNASGINGSVSSESPDPTNDEPPRQTCKRKKREDEREENGKEGRSPPGRNSSNNPNLPLWWLACPFAKGKPLQHSSCLLISRKDLAGIKEHLKRRHFNRVMPPEIRAAKTWNGAFDHCCPGWLPKPRPSPFVDILNCYNIAMQAPEAPFQKFPTTISVTFSNSPHTVETIQPNPEELRLDIPESLITSSSLPEMMRPHLCWPLNPSEITQLGHVPTIPEQPDATSPDISIESMYPIILPPSFQPDDSASIRSSYELGYDNQHFNYTQHIVPQIYPTGYGQVIAQPLNVSPFGSAGPLTAMGSYPFCRSRSSAASSSGSSGRQSQLSSSPGTSVSSSQEPYLVYVLPKNANGRHKYYFNTKTEFESTFETWLGITFADPQFSWDSMEFHHDSKGRDEVLTSLEEVWEELDIWFIRNVSRKAALSLRLKEETGGLPIFGA
ncbi:hypothetical protein H072_4665 [Dactylellina haptotyla CBS 200.50]|uniref:Uncharacterized protein n=1 Tax=Dactylellina haptotyla (strain CBS 200.50) TaxID=1284197 RepID=S8AEI2_DACHA|nr:hypothetical protein H072_4665 [Dactylellina haptotyla CBS 200.50]